MITITGSGNEKNGRKRMKKNVLEEGFHSSSIPSSETGRGAPETLFCVSIIVVIPRVCLVVNLPID